MARSDLDLSGGVPLFYAVTNFDHLCYVFDFRSLTFSSSKHLRFRAYEHRMIHAHTYRGNKSASDFPNSSQVDDCTPIGFLYGLGIIND